MSLTIGPSMGNLLVKSAVTDFAIQWGLFVVAAALKTEKFYDLAGSGTFIILAIQSLRWGGKYFLRQRVQSALVITWATRLGIYLFARILKDGHDVRFDGIRDSPVTFFAAWTIQGLVYTFSLAFCVMVMTVALTKLEMCPLDSSCSGQYKFYVLFYTSGLWVLITLLPTLVLNSKQKDQETSTRDYIGWGMWLIGFIVEALADYQKSAFRANPENAGRFITSGLWSVSRHPNYLGEIIMWLGLYLSASSSLQGLEHLGVISPLFVTFLLTKVSGIPLLERAAQKKWGNDPLFQAYCRSTALLVPYLY